MKISKATVASKQNFTEKYHRLMKNLYFIFRLIFFTSNECFSHFNVHQLLSKLSHFFQCSQAQLKIMLKTKTFSLDFTEFRILRYVLQCSVFFRARLENPKINKRAGEFLITAMGSDFFSKKNKREVGRLFGTLEQSVL